MLRKAGWGAELRAGACNRQIANLCVVEVEVEVKVQIEIESQISLASLSLEKERERERSRERSREAMDRSDIIYDITCTFLMWHNHMSRF